MARKHQGIRARTATLAATAALLGGTVALVGGSPASADPSPPTPNFTGVDRLPSGTSRFLVAADLDEDGRNDLLSVKGSGTAALLQVRLASPTTPGAFADPVAVPLGQSTADLQTGDLDGDGHLDVAAGFGQYGYLVLYGAGDGTFAASSGGTQRADAVAIGDLVGDSHPDLAIGTTASDGAGGSTSGVVTMAGDGARHLGTPSTPIAMNGWIRSIVATDVSGDGHADLVVANRGPGGLLDNVDGFVSVVRSDGSGGWLARDDHQITADLPGPIRVADLDEDGTLDLVSGTEDNRGPGSGWVAGVWTLHGLGAGTFADAVLQPMGTRLHDVAVADLDGDGHQDLAATNETGIEALVRFGNGDGTFQAPVSFALGFYPYPLVAADLNGDGQPDLASITSGNAGLPGGLVFGWNLGDGTFDAGTALAVSTTINAIGDLDGDGSPDLLAGSVPAYNDGKGRLQLGTKVTLPASVAATAVGDLTGDGRGDVLATSPSGLSVATSGPGRTIGAATTTPLGSQPTAIALGDLDEDGALDAVITDKGASTVLVLLGNGDGTFSAPTSRAVGASPSALALRDLDGDGHLDVAVANTASPSLSVLLGDGAGGLGPATSVTLPAAPRQVVAGDLDGDGSVDLAATTGTGADSAVVTVLGNGDGTFAAGASTTLTASLGMSAATAAGLAIGDTNRDGHLDLAVDGQRILVNAGDGTFAQVDIATTYVDAIGPAALVDMDGDGHADLVGPMPYHGYSIVRLNLAPGGAVTPPPAPGWMPCGSWGALVERIYQDLLHRLPTAAERSAAVTALTNATLTRGELVAQLRASADHTGNVDPVVRLYRAYFLRNPDPSGLDHWAAKRRASATLSSVSNAFARSSEFQRRYGSLTNTQFVDLVYQNVLGRAGDASGRAFWIKRLTNRTSSRGQVMLNFSESSEFKTKSAHLVDVAVVRTWLLRQTQSGTPFQDAVAALDGGGTTAQLGEDVLGSGPFAARVAAL